MSDQLFTSIVSITTAIVGVAILATIVSKNSNTAGVITAASSGYSQILATALSPVTGSGGFTGLNNNTFNSNISGF